MAKTGHYMSVLSITATEAGWTGTMFLHAIFL